MSAATFWGAIVVVGAGTLLIRMWPIMRYGKTHRHPLIERALRYVPAAALAALVAPSALFMKSLDGYEFSPARTVASLAALVIALKYRNAAITLVVGMSVLWAAQVFIG